MCVALDGHHITLILFTNFVYTCIIFISPSDTARGCNYWMAVMKSESWTCTNSLWLRPGQPLRESHGWGAIN
jgi:hypothetical protein